MTDQIKLDVLIGAALLALGVLGYIVFLRLQNTELKSKLEKSELENDKNKNAQIVHGESDPALKSEIANDFGANSPQTIEATNVTLPTVGPAPSPYLCVDRPEAEKMAACARNEASCETRLNTCVKASQVSASKFPWDYVLPVLFLLLGAVAGHNSK